jgi:transcriptional regulator with XRE-family HTH domain
MDQATMSPDEQSFFQRLGERIASLRRERGLTQVQLAEMLGCSQQQVLSFEKGRRRVPVSTLPGLAKTLGISIEELIGAEAQPAKRGPTPKLQRQLEQLSQLPRSRQRFISEMLDTVLQQAGR